MATGVNQIDRPLFKMGPTKSELDTQFYSIEIPDQDFNTIKITDNNNDNIILEGRLDNPLTQIELIRLACPTIDNPSPLLRFFATIEQHTFNQNTEKNIQIKTAIELAALKVLTTHDALLLSDNTETQQSFEIAIKNLQDLVYKHTAGPRTKGVDVLQALGNFLFYFAAIGFVSAVLGFMLGMVLNNAGLTFDFVGLQPLLDALQLADNPFTAGALVGGLIGAVGLAVGAYNGIREAKSTSTLNFHAFFSSENNPLGTTTFIAEIDNDDVLPGSVTL